MPFSDLPSETILQIVEETITQTNFGSMHALRSVCKDFQSLTIAAATTHRVMEAALPELPNQEIWHDWSDTVSCNNEEARIAFSLSAPTKDTIFEAFLTKVLDVLTDDKDDSETRERYSKMLCRAAAQEWDPKKLLVLLHHNSKLSANPAAAWVFRRYQQEKDPNIYGKDHLAEVDVAYPDCSNQEKLSHCWYRQFYSAPKVLLKDLSIANHALSAAIILGLQEKVEELIAKNETDREADTLFGFPVVCALRSPNWNILQGVTAWNVNSARYSYVAYRKPCPDCGTTIRAEMGHDFLPICRYCFMNPGHNLIKLAIEVGNDQLVFFMLAAQCWRRRVDFEGIKQAADAAAMTGRVSLLQTFLDVIVQKGQRRYVPFTQFIIDQVDFHGHGALFDRQALQMPVLQPLRGRRGAGCYS
ncbi:hypothetical protein EJ08DRAFT_244833 [Tothia fuscella]|uniref:Uncharacterized protein n=1 Tax=Tothia fuscella TaxID=1048955 RepID=A0A9P4NS72_9PEZI|nr:hypothetical protein EJ08DRAFT_244833 [Tothia fuscella]